MQFTNKIFLVIVTNCLKEKKLKQGTDVSQPGDQGSCGQVPKHSVSELPSRWLPRPTKLNYISLVFLSNKNCKSERERERELRGAGLQHFAHICRTLLKILQY